MREDRTGIKGSLYTYQLRRNRRREADGRIHSSWSSGFTTDYRYQGSAGDKATPACKYFLCDMSCLHFKDVKCKHS